jgi:hypothetical protein
MPKILIHNSKTNEILEREMNADELAQYEANQTAAEAEATAKTEAKQALLDRLGISADEAALLGV